MRRIIQATGAEVIHLGHDRSAAEIVNCAIQEDVNAIAITSYQGGHVEFFKYIIDLLKEKDSSQIKVFGGGGGTILPQEMQELHMVREKNSSPKYLTISCFSFTYLLELPLPQRLVTGSICCPLLLDGPNLGPTI